MRLFLIGLIGLAFLYSCSSSESTDEKSTLIGRWTAKWETDPSSFPGVNDVNSFTMNGELIFYPDSVQINAFGFPGCIFSSDTLRHSLKWVISNDTLNLLNEDDVYGMSYTIKSISGQTVELQLMDDIVLTLSK